MKVDEAVLQRISQEIRALTHHEHVQSVDRLNSFAYRLKYQPLATSSPYKGRTYNLELILPSTYPNGPPSLRFLDQIYHLNVGLSSGEVRMPVLEDDWSPYLTLNSLFQSLDGVLEEPDEAYSLDDEVLHLFQTDPQQYMSKVIEHVSLGDVVLCQSAEKRALSNDIQNESVTEYKSSSKQLNPTRPRDNEADKERQKKKASILMENLRQSMEEYDERSRMEMIESNDDDEGERSTNKHREKLKIVRTVSKQHMSKPKSKRDQNKDRDFQSLKMDTAQSMEAVQVNILPKNRKESLKSKASNPNQEHQSENLALQKINSTIGVFIEQLNEIEDQMVLSKNQGIKQLLREKHEAQLDMLRELLDLSEETKRRIMHKLKEQVNHI